MKDQLVISLIGILSLLVLFSVGFVLLGQQVQIREHYDVSALPAVNSFLNGTSAVLLTVGYLFIRQRKVTAHKVCMVSAFAVSSLFLISYLVYHYHAGSTPFRCQVWIRLLYFALLIPHITLAALIVPLALTTIYRAWQEQFNKHMKIARWTLPLWMYVSVSGVLIYWLLYHVYAPL
jgi:putative membrane protein